VTRDRSGILATCVSLLILSLMSVPGVRAVSEGDTVSDLRRSGASAPDTPEFAFLSLLNESRAAALLPPLHADDTLAAFARSHTRAMVERHALFHSAHDARVASAPAGWRRLGENVGVGESAETLHAAFMNSPRHRDNVLGDYDGVAIGSERDQHGQLYVTVVFVKRGAPTTIQLASTHR
jgi:uncharacterized protein YkwD